MPDAIHEPTAHAHTASMRPAGLTLRTLVQACGATAFAKRADPGKLERGLFALLSPLMDQPIAAVHADAVRRLIDTALAAGLEPHTLNLRIYTLRKLVREAVRVGLLAHDPIADLQTLRCQEARNRMLTPVERSRLWRALFAEEQFLRSFGSSSNATGSPAAVSAGVTPNVETPFSNPLTPKVMFSMATGLARGHSDRLTWSAVDLTQNFMTVPTRRGALQKIPLHEAVADLLRRWRRQCRGDLVFPERIPALKGVSVRSSWGHLMEAVPVSALHWNDFRSDFGNYLVERGAPLEHVRYLLAGSRIGDIDLTLNDAFFDSLRDTLALRLVDFPLTLEGLATYASTDAVITDGDDPSH